jgi:hypothetical protein
MGGAGAGGTWFRLAGESHHYYVDIQNNISKRHVRSSSHKRRDKPTKIVELQLVVGNLVEMVHSSILAAPDLVSRAKGLEKKGYVCRYCGRLVRLRRQRGHLRTNRQGGQGMGKNRVHINRIKHTVHFGQVLCGPLAMPKGKCVGYSC